MRRIERNVALLCIPGDKTFLDCFSDPNAPALLTASEFVSGDASSCEGDSGSGAFDQAAFDQGRPVGLGVLSRGSVSADLTTCIQPIYTRFDAWASLLVDAAHRAASAGGYAPPAWADAIGVSPRPDAGGGRPAPPPDASMSEQMAVRAPSGCCAAPGVPLRRDASAVILCLGALAMGRYRRASRLPPERKAPRLVSKPGGQTPGNRPRSSTCAALSGRTRSTALPRDRLRRRGCGGGRSRRCDRGGHTYATEGPTLIEAVI